MPLTPSLFGEGRPQRWELPATTEASGQARTFLEPCLRAWGCGRVDDLLLVCSELVTNAVIHARSHPQLVAQRHGDVVRLEIHDQSSVPPQTRSDLDPGGYGLRIVDATSDQWGWTPTPSGKLVWATFSCS